MRRGLPIAAYAGFNEAPAFHWGKPIKSRREARSRRRFNEAPAFHWGKRRSQTIPIHPLCCFNEAPAFHWGKPTAGTSQHAREQASMRPQHFTGENTDRSLDLRSSGQASMRPQHFTGENPSVGASPKR